MTSQIKQSTASPPLSFFKCPWAFTTADPNGPLPIAISLISILLSSCFHKMDLFAQPVLCQLCYGLAGFMTPSANYFVCGGLSLYLLPCAKSCSIPHDRFRNPTDEASTHGSIFKETKDERSNSI